MKWSAIDYKKYLLVPETWHFTSIKFQWKLWHFYIKYSIFNEIKSFIAVQEFEQFRSFKPWDNGALRENNCNQWDHEYGGNFKMKFKISKNISFSLEESLKFHLADFYFSKLNLFSSLQPFCNGSNVCWKVRKWNISLFCILTLHEIWGDFDFNKWVRRPHESGQSEASKLKFIHRLLIII